MRKQAIDFLPLVKTTKYALLLGKTTTDKLLLMETNPKIFFPVKTKNTYFVLICPK